jgi:hypothetical protein
MNYKEFKKEIEKVDYLTVSTGDFNEVCVESSLGINSGIARISDTGKVDFTWHGVIKAIHMQKVIKLIEAFAETPYEERMDKKFYLIIGGKRIKHYNSITTRNWGDLEKETTLSITFSDKHAKRFSPREKEETEIFLKNAEVKFEWEEA